MIYDFLLGFTLLIGIFPWLAFKVKDRPGSDIRPLQPFLVLMAVGSIYELVASKLLSVPSKIWFAVYSVLEFAAVLYFFYQALQKVSRLYFVMFGVAYISLLVYFELPHGFLAGLNADGLHAIMATIFVFVSSAIWFKAIFTDMTGSPLLRSSLFWVVSGLLLYFAGTLYLFIVSDYLIKNPAIDIRRYWILNIVFNLFLRIILLVSIWKGQQRLTGYSG
ncbi:MAG: hypothetical protein EOO01_30255 [Chitinophagaceae bacterium]|nr:MAG: hypothetical protein EOO01_30255 [Chitinophagaceae bacterium]